MCQGEITFTGGLEVDLSTANQDKKIVFIIFVLSFLLVILGCKSFHSRNPIQTPFLVFHYLHTSYAACQTTWIKMLLKELKIMESKKMNLFVDNKSAIDLENHHMCHGQSKQIESRYHFLGIELTKECLNLSIAR